jgi:nondiscriminating glutamyl-tRNA synthetase
MRLRFAPSPTGQLHVGTARTALFNWLLARGAGGTFVLRIEDTDLGRSSRESEAAILEDLRWMGLEWGEGVEVGGDAGPYRQTERLHIYRAHTVELLSRGQAYRCFCSAEQLEADRQQALAVGRPPQYVGRCRDVPVDTARRRVENGEKAVIRFRVPSGREIVFQDVVRGEVRFHTSVIGDPVLVRSDGVPAYNFVVVVDDALMGITHVIRGEDHISNTPRQLLLYQALGFTPPEFAHLSLVMGADHTPLSKRHGATSVSEFRGRGYLPEALVNYLALIGWSPRTDGGSAEGDAELLPVDEMARRFAIEDVGHSAGIFDLEKLAWMNRHYMKAAAPARLAAESLQYFTAREFVTRRTDEAMEFVTQALPMAVGSVDRLEEIPDRLRFLFDFDPTAALAKPEVAEVAHAPGARDVIAALAEELRETGRLDRETFRAAANRVRQRTGQKARALFHPIRVALTGEAGGPELDLAIPAIERGAELARSSGVAPVLGCRERAQQFVETLDRDRAQDLSNGTRTGDSYE